MINFNDLRKEIPYKFKPQTVKNGKAIMVAYIDARDVQDLLDEVVGPDNWQTDYRVINENMFAGVGIRVNDQWVWKWDCGTESNVEQEKGEASDAFKRAAVQWGIGRFLYRLGMFELPTKDYNGKERPATKEGKILWSNEDITNYIRSGALDKPAGKKDAEPSKPAKYEKPTSEPSYSKVEYSDTTIKRVTTLKRGSLSGKECLKQFIPNFNEKFKTDYKSVSAFKDDKLLNSLIDFIESIPPDNI